MLPVFEECVSYSESLGRPTLGGVINVKQRVVSRKICCACAKAAGIQVEG